MQRPNGTARKSIRREASPLRAFRMAHHLSARELATLAGVAHSGIVRAERFERGLPANLLRFVRASGHDSATLELLHEAAFAARKAEIGAEAEGDGAAR